MKVHQPYRVVDEEFEFSLFFNDVEEWLQDPNRSKTLLAGRYSITTEDLGVEGSNEPDPNRYFDRQKALLESILSEINDVFEFDTTNLEIRLDEPGPGDFTFVL